MQVPHLGPGHRDGPSRRTHPGQADAPGYFADPRSPWQRPSNENTNGLIREYLPKGIEITDHQPYLDAIAEELNERLRATLSFLTSREALERLLLDETVATTT